MTTNFDIAKPVSDRVQIRSVTLEGANVESSLNPLHLPESLTLKQRHDTRYEIYEEQTTYIFINVDFDLLIFDAAQIREVDDTDATDSVLQLVASFLLIYDIKDHTSFSEDNFASFADLNAPFNAWPYWRELVQTVTGRVGLAGITIPVFRPKKVQIGNQIHAVSAKKKTRKKKKTTKKK